MLLTPDGFIPRLDELEQLDQPDNEAPDNGGYWFVVHDGKLLVTRGDTPHLPSSALAAMTGIGQAQYFGEYGGRPCRLVMLEPDALVAFEQEYEWRGLRSLFGILPDAEANLAGRALQLAEWSRTHRHCGCCGAPMQRQPGERAMLCPACGFTAYPRIAPAMMVLVRRDERILLARAPNFVPGVYSALAGFVEAGESLEDCVHREVREEVGIEVTNLRYFRSQSWPFPHSLMLAFVADHASGELQPNPAELTDAQWFGLDSLPKLPNRHSISHALIQSVLDDLRSRTK